MNPTHSELVKLQTIVVVIIGGGYFLIRGSVRIIRID